MKDPERRTSDSTIHAVLQLLCNEIADLNHDSILIHEQGLDNLVQNRGGVESIDDNGFLATSITA